MIIGVLVEISSKMVDKIFEYSVSEEFIDKIKIGIRVLVPFGKMTLEGFVLEIKDNKSTDKDLREIIDVVDEDVILNDELLELGKYLKNTTLATLINCYQVMLPKALKAKNGTNINIKYDIYYELNNYDKNIKFNDSQKKMIDLLLLEGSVLRKRLVDISLSSLNTLIKKGILKEKRIEHYRLNHNNTNCIKKKLTDEQSLVVDEVINGDKGTYLLYGVTGSGKTEVYMEIIDYYLKLNKTAIVLVPEISLTPQMINRFSNRFGDRIAAIHSGLSDGEKYDEYRRITKGEVDIVIGARSAIFVPLKNIGIIIIDEEHSESYKQSDPSPRYHSRDIAIARAKYHNCSVVLGSATPSLESMARAEKGVYNLLKLPHRVNGHDLPSVNLIDMNQSIRKTRGHFSDELIKAIEDRLEKKEQVILLLNRRGYANFVTCKNCGYTFKCPNCDITLTYHKTSNTLRCHYCGYGEKSFTKCPSCQKESLNSLGVGTQRIEEELYKLFSNVRVLRMDYDTTSKKGSHEKMIESFKNYDYDILLGTQMVSKGLDFSNVTLVGVINADTSLNIPDFRSSENTFSLLDQVAGRSGRCEKTGEVIIQTFNPDHYAINLVKNHDYLSFYKKEMDMRRKLKYPPYYYLCNIKISGKDSKYILDEAKRIRNHLEQNLNNIIILGPSVSGAFKINNIFRYNIILKYKKQEDIYKILYDIMEHYKMNVKVKIDIDFNPSKMI